MTVLQAFILGIVQGLTEFLPISSSGHLVLFQRLFGLQEGVVTFDIAVHLATLIAICVVFKDDIIYLLKNPFSKLTFLIIVGTIPAILFGAFLKKHIDFLFESGSSLGFEFILTAVVLLYSESVKGRDKKLEGTSYVDAFLIGVAQAVAILPAVSRSGLTISGALWRGLNREFAAKFSFLLSIPAILGAAVLDFKDVFDVQTGATGFGVDVLPLIVGMVAAAISGYFAIRFMLRLLTRGNMKGFAYYVLILAALILTDQLFFGLFFDKII